MRGEYGLDLNDQLCFALYSASRAVMRAYSDRLSKYDLTYPQYLVLLVLWEWERAPPPRPTVKALGARLDLDSGTLTPLLRRLAGKGILTRQRSTDDERELCVQLTAMGKGLMRQVAKIPATVHEESRVSAKQWVDLRDKLMELSNNLKG